MRGIARRRMREIARRRIFHFINDEKDCELVYDNTFISRSTILDFVSVNDVQLLLQSDMSFSLSGRKTIPALHDVKMRKIPYRAKKNFPGVINKTALPSSVTATFIAK